jgi:predicted GTPase
MVTFLGGHDYASLAEWRWLNGGRCGRSATMASSESLKRTVIMGAAGRDFHNFNLVYRDDPNTRVVAFTAAQIPGIAERRYPTSLAGPRYPDGIPIMAESELEALCREERVDDVVFAYSDVPHATVMHAASRALAAGSDFLLLGPNCTMLTAPVPVIAVSAIRTGCGKSQTTRWLGRLLSRYGLQVAVIRHPMPYGDLARQAVQRFATRDAIWTRPTARSRNERNTSRTWPPAPWSTPGWTMGGSWSARRRRRM